MAYEDLIKDTSQSFENGNYFIVTITDLDVNQPYPVQFRWKNKDGTFSKWGAAKILSTPGESDPATPRLQSANVVGGAGYLSVTWDGKNSTGADLTNIDRVDIYIDNPPFDGTKPADNFKTAGTKTFVAPAGSYTVTLVAVSKLGTLSPTSAAITKTVTSVSTPVTTPEDPSAPTITTGLASIVVSWNGKNSSGSNFTAGAFAGAKVYIGTTSTFTPSADNWVHSLNFANGTNQVSIGVGTVINKTTGATLQYGTPYYIKLRTINAEGTETSTAIASSPTNVTVDKLPASEIKTGILAADASITAGASGGARVVMSGASSPFIIYGTDGSTKLLEFIGGSTGTLAITGSSTFSGNISVGSGNSIFKAEPLTGLWLGNATESSAPFSVSVNGAVRATSGTIGGWYLGSSTLQNASSNPTIRLNTSGIIVGATSSSYIDIAADGITHRNSNGTASGKFTLTTGSSPSLTVNGSITASTFSLSGSNGDSWSSGGAFQFGGSSGIKYSGSGNLTIGSSGNTVTIDTSTGAVTVANITASQFSINTNNYWNSTGFKVGDGTNKLEFVSSTGALTITGQIDRGSNNYWNSTGFEVGNGTNKLQFVSSTGALNVTGTVTATTGYFKTGYFGDDTSLYNYWTVGGSDGKITSASYYQSGYTQIVLDPYNGEITGGRIASSKLEATTITGSTITGNTIVGDRIASSSSSTRIELINATNDSLRAIIGSSVKGHVLGYGNSTTGGMVMMAGSTANPDVTSGHVRVLPNYAALAGTSTNYVEATGSQINVRGGTSGIYLTGGGSVYMQSGDTTTSTANVFINSTSGLLARSTSSIRYKTDVETISFDENAIKMLRPVKYHGIKDIERGDTNWYAGLIAEEVAEIPGLELFVSYNEEGQPDSVNYDRLVIVIANVLSKVLDRLDALEG